MKNLGAMMKQAQEMQTRMQEMQEQMEALEIDGGSGGGLISVTVTGKGEVRRLSIDPSLIVPDDREVLEDLIVAAINDAKNKADEKMREETQKLMGGIQLPPGMKLPF
ncbi:YbaB/EbfC family nucleoid-associated protein [Pacificispira sp.]|uniref:YbaB/EbfC family nucleoid-associated protein n=1 Tax=Pacificispira sp. TaxID=2888761 RepID=UPI003BA8D0CA